MNTEGAELNLSPRQIAMMNDLNSKEFSRISANEGNNKKLANDQTFQHFFKPNKKSNRFLPDVVRFDNQSKAVQTSIIWVCILLFIISISGLYILWGTDLINSAVVSSLIIKNNTDAYVMWKKPPVKAILRVYIWNYTNVEDFKQNGTKLKVEELGPYAFIEHLERVNEIFHSNGTITYQENRTYKFLPEKSSPNVQEFDKVVVPNIPLTAAMNLVRDSLFIWRLGFNSVLRNMESRDFISLPANEFLWGYHDNFLDLAKKVTFKDDIPEKWGFLHSRKGLSPNRITIDTGENGVDTLGTIRMINGEENLSQWQGNCNALNGTDGSLFPLDLVHNLEPIEVYNGGLCRKIKLLYNETIISDISGDKSMTMPMLRYRVDPNMFTSGEAYPNNKCFCKNQCLPDGLFNVSKCFKNTPIIISFPHFFRANLSTIKTVDGNFKPTAELHETFLDIHPNLAVPLRGRSAVQINIMVKSINGIDLYENFPEPTLLPVGWFQISIEEMPDYVLKKLYLATFTVAAAQTILKFLFLIIASLTLSFLLIWFLFSNKKDNAQVLDISPISMVANANKSINSTS